MLVYGNFVGNSGYAVHSRKLTEALMDLTDVKILQAGGLPDNAFDLIGYKLEKAIQNNNKHIDFLSISLPPNALYFSGDRFNFSQYCVFEGDKIPEYWVNVLNENFIKNVIVPSNHVKRAAEVSGVKINKIKVIPHGVDVNVFKPGNPMFEKTGFVFGWVGGWKDGVLDRKGLDLVLTAFSNSFKEEEEVYLYIKINCAYQKKEDVIKEINKLNLPVMYYSNPRVKITFDDLKEKSMVAFYNSLDCFVSASKAEAFNLPVLEAMACGKPVIVNGFGGEVDFVNEKNGWILDYELAPATGGLLYDGVNWSKPNVEQLQKFMREAFDKKNLTKTKGAYALETALCLTWENSAKKVLELFK